MRRSCVSGVRSRAKRAARLVVRAGSWRHARKLRDGAPRTCARRATRGSSEPACRGWACSASDAPAAATRSDRGNAGMPLDGLRVVELATIVAGPSAGKYLADFGADVIKVEHPKAGDTTRSMGYKHEGVALWWKLVGRNKRPVTLNLSHPKGQEIAAAATRGRRRDRSKTSGPAPSSAGTSAPESLAELNPRLIVLRISGFGQTGPYARKPGFGTLGRVDLGRRAHLGDARRTADAPGDRARRRGCRARRRVRRDDGAPRTRALRQGPSDRRVALRVAVPAHRAARDGVRQARHRDGADREPDRVLGARGTHIAPPTGTGSG